MGARANYAIRQNGRVELFFAHWGALTIAEDIFDGPENTELFIRRNTASSVWLDDLDAEGGVVLEKDSKVVAYKLSWEGWPHEDDIKEVYVRALATNWQGWKVREVEEWAELAAAAGVPASEVTAVRKAPNLLPLDELGTNLLRPLCAALMSVKQSGCWTDYAIDYNLCAVLMNGPAVVDYAPLIADLNTLREAFTRRNEDDSAQTLGDSLTSHAAIDVEERVVRVSFDLDFWLDDLPFLQQAWAGWTLIAESGRTLVSHFEFTKRSVPADLIPSSEPANSPVEARSYEECMRLIREQLERTDEAKMKAVQSFRETVNRFAEQAGPVTVNEAALRATPSSRAEKIASSSVRTDLLGGLMGILASLRKRFR